MPSAGPLGQPSKERAWILAAGELAVLRSWRQVAIVSSPALIGQAALLPILSALAAHAGEGEGSEEELGVGEVRAHTGEAAGAGKCRRWGRGWGR